MSLRYDRMGSTCSGKSQPGTVALDRAIRERWPVCEFAGVYNCRPVRGGSSLSAHGEGRAADEHLDQPGPGKANPAGWPIARLLVERADPLGIQCVIWDRQIWSVPNPSWRVYGGSNPHYDHIHVEQNWGGAKDLTLTQARQLVGDQEDDMPVPQNYLDAIARMDARVEAIFSAVERFDQLELPEVDAALAAIQVQLSKASDPQDPAAFAEAVVTAFGEDVAKQFAKAFADIIKAGAG